jgi:uroporphyrinogen decarboxylase
MTTGPDFARFKTALLGGTPDRVPLAEVLVDHEIKEAFLREEVGDVETDLRFWLDAGYDYIILGRRLIGYPPFWDRAALRTYYDVQARRAGTPGGRGPIRNWNDFRAYPWQKPSEIDFAIFDEIEKRLPTNVKVVRYLGPIFQIVWMLMGLEGFSYALQDEPDLVRALFEKVGNLVLAEFDEVLERDSVGAIWFLDDVAFKGGLMVRPSILQTFQFPFIREMAGRCRERGIPFVYHTDGNVKEIIPDLVQMGVCALHPLEPVSVDIYEMKRQWGNRLCLIGNIELASVLATGTVDEVIEDTKLHIRRLAPGGAYCLGSSNSVTGDVPIENYRAMIDTVIKFGEYPISV